MAPASHTLAPGYTFCPPDSEITDHYLRDELAGKPVPGWIHHVDIYSADPEHLVEKLAHAPGTGKDKKPPVWYFISSVQCAAGHKTAGGRKARAVVGGTWHQENTKAVKGSTLGGEVKTFTYVNKSSSGTERLGWIMKEFDISPQNGGGDRVLCKIYRTPRPTKSRASASFVSDYGGSRKRKAASDHPDAPTQSARRMDDEDYFQFPENVFMEGSNEFEHNYGTATHTPGGEIVELPQKSYLPSSEFYGTTETHGSDLEVPPSMELAPESFFPSSDFYGTSNTQGQGNDDNFTENVGQVFMQGSGESEHYDTAANYYQTTTQHMPGGEATQLLPCVQESFLSSSEFYWTSAPAEMQGGDIDLDELLKQPTDTTNYQLSDEEIEALILEVIN
jgi:hypothetical protein